ncbi:MAG: succinate dehydrogenase assembly factor 2 [Caldimonas sp.]
MVASEHIIDARALSKLRWRCRRGLLENDLLIERFFASHAGAGLTTSQAAALADLMDLADNDLLDLLLSRCEPIGELDTPAVRDLLLLMRTHH